MYTMARVLQLLVSAAAVVALLACADAQYCATDILGNTNAHPIQLPAVPIHPYKYNLETKASEACATKMLYAVGVKVTVCSSEPPSPTVHITELECADVTNTRPAIVYVTAYCSYNQRMSLDGARGLPPSTCQQNHDGK